MDSKIDIEYRQVVKHMNQSKVSITCIIMADTGTYCMWWTKFFRFMQIWCLKIITMTTSVDNLFRHTKDLREGRWHCFTHCSYILFWVFVIFILITQLVIIYFDSNFHYVFTVTQLSHQAQKWKNHWTIKSIFIVCLIYQEIKSSDAIQKKCRGNTLILSLNILEALKVNAIIFHPPIYKYHCLEHMIIK